MVESATSERAYRQQTSLNPAEEARPLAQGEQHALEGSDVVAAVDATSRNRRVRTGPFQPGPAPYQPTTAPAEALVVLRHTTFPRLLVAFTPLLLLMGLGCAALLRKRGLLTESTGVDMTGDRVTEYHLDPSMNTVAIGIVFLVFAVPIFAWGWWAVAATLNARAKSCNSGWPWTLPLSALVAVVALLGATFMPQGPRPVMFIVFAVAYVWSAYGALFSLRKSANAIKADDVYWTRLIWIPWFSGVVVVAVLVASSKLGSAEIAVFGLLVPLGILMWSWSTLCQGMASFDRSCRVAHVARGDATGLPPFMMGPRGVR